MNLKEIITITTKDKATCEVSDVTGSGDSVRSNDTLGI